MQKNKSRKGLFSFFSTTAGRKLAFVGACTATASLFIGNYFPHTFLLKKYREIITCYQNGQERLVSDKVLKRLDKAFNKLNLHLYERKLIKPFTVYGFDIYQAGSTNYKFGGILGIPTTFSYDTINDFDLREVRFRNEPINWTSEGGKILKDSLILSEDEQIFGMCKAILQLQTHKPLLNAIFPSASFLMVYTIGHYLNQRMDLFARPLSVRMVLYLILGLFGFGLWSLLKDYNQVRYDVEIDKALSELGQDFVEAGIGYYDKILKRNIALRNLMGGSTYTVKGNENYFIRQKSLPLTLRKSFFETKLEEIKKQLQQKTESASQ